MSAFLVLIITTEECFDIFNFSMDLSVLVHLRLNSLKPEKCEVSKKKIVTIFLLKIDPENVFFSKNWKKKFKILEWEINHQNIHKKTKISAKNLKVENSIKFTKKMKIRQKSIKISFFCVNIEILSLKNIVTFFFEDSHFLDF